MGAITDDAHGSEPVLHFRDGIPGFPGPRRFVLADLGEGEGAKRTRKTQEAYTSRE
jgi:hypothetical protein